MNASMHKLYVLFICIPVLCWAQLSNEGEFTIAPGVMVSVMEEFVNLETGALVNDGEITFSSHFNNYGYIDFTLGSNGLVIFKGNETQYIAGSQLSYFNNVKFDNNSISPNGAHFLLSGEISVENSAEFYRGIVSNDDWGGQILFQQNATAMNAFDGSYVDGTVTKVGNAAFVFPIGDNEKFRPSAITSPLNENDIFSAKYFYQYPDASYPVNKFSGNLSLINDKEYWQVIKVSGNSDVKISLTWDVGVTNPEIYREPMSAIRIARWDDQQQMWVDEGGELDLANKSVTTSVEVDGYGIFTLARLKGDSTLPEDVFIYNTVTPNNDGRNDYFIIDNIQRLKNNSVEIYNRWGQKVYMTTDYDTSGNVFNGFATKGLVVNNNKKLPTGTYFYILSYDNPHSPGKKSDHTGFLHLITE